MQARSIDLRLTSQAEFKRQRRMSARMIKYCLFVFAAMTATKRALASGAGACGAFDAQSEAVLSQTAIMQASIARANQLGRGSSARSLARRLESVVELAAQSGLDLSKRLSGAAPTVAPRPLDRAAPAPENFDPWPEVDRRSGIGPSGTLWNHQSGTAAVFNATEPGSIDYENPRIAKAMRPSSLSGQITTAAFSPDGSHLTVGLAGRRIFRFKVTGSGRAFEAGNSDKETLAIASAPNDRYVVVQTNNHVSFYNAFGRLIGEVSAEIDPIPERAVFDDTGAFGALVVRATLGRVGQSLLTWDCDGLKLKTSTHALATFDHWLSFDPGKRQFLASHADFGVDFWNLEGVQHFPSIAAPDQPPPSRAGPAAALRDGRVIAAAGDRLYFADSERREVLGWVTHRYWDGAPTIGLAVAPNGKYVAILSAKGIVVWNANERFTEAQTIPLDSVADEIEFHGDSQTIEARARAREGVGYAWIRIFREDADRR